MNWKDRFKRKQQPFFWPLLTYETPEELEERLIKELYESSNQKEI